MVVFEVDLLLCRLPRQIPAVAAQRLSHHWPATVIWRSSWWQCITKVTNTVDGGASVNLNLNRGRCCRGVQKSIVRSLGA
jgi:hypothetical protein